MPKHRTTQVPWKQPRRQEPGWPGSVTEQIIEVLAALAMLASAGGFFAIFLLVASCAGRTP